MKKVLVTTIGILLIAAACNKPVALPPEQKQETAASVYENSYMKVTIPEGWATKAPSSNPAAVNITKGKYILYINTQASQASGVDGGRFSEIAMGAPSADAVVTVHPGDPCGTSEESVAFDKYSRFDFYVSASDKKSYCVAPTNGKTVWYFSYLTSPKNGYFNYYTTESHTALVVTMSYNSKDVSILPAKDNTELNTMLSEMTSIAESLVVKQK